MTYTIANHHNGNLSCEQSSWVVNNRLVQRRCWQPKYNQVYADLNIGEHCDIYVTDENLAFDNLNDAIDSVTIAPDDYDSYPSELDTIADEDYSVTITQHQPKDQGEAIALANNFTNWQDIGTYGSWNCGKIEQGHYQRIGTVKQRKDGIVEYAYVGMAYRSNPTAATIQAAIVQVKKGFISQQSYRRSVEWKEYFNL